MIGGQEAVRLRAKLLNAASDFATVGKVALLSKDLSVLILQESNPSAGVTLFLSINEKDTNTLAAIRANVWIECCTYTC